MNDYYTEQMVKKQADMKDMLIKAVLIAVTIVSFLIVLAFCNPHQIIFRIHLSLLLFCRLPCCPFPLWVKN